jgi:hypothetical protein
VQHLLGLGAAAQIDQQAEQSLARCVIARVLRKRFAQQRLGLAVAPGDERVDRAAQGVLRALRGAQLTVLAFDAGGA